MQKDQQFSRLGRNSHIWSNEPSLWPWTGRQQTNLLVGHFGLCCCITIPNFVTEEISSRWTFAGILNFLCELDLDHNKAIQSFHTTVHLMMMYHQTKFSCKRISSLYIKNLYFDYIIPNCDLDLEDGKSIFLKNSLTHNHASPYQVWQ